VPSPGGEDGEGGDEERQDERGERRGAVGGGLPGDGAAADELSGESRVERDRREHREVRDGAQDELDTLLAVARGPPAGAECATDAEEEDD
jgi:hypothetical protein